MLKRLTNPNGAKFKIVKENEYYYLYKNIGWIFSDWKCIYYSKNRTDVIEKMNEESTVEVEYYG